MGGSQRTIDEASAIVASRSQAVPGGGGHASASFLVDVTAITRTSGTLIVTVSYTAPSGTPFTIAATGALTTTGLFRLAIDSDFEATRMAVPEPDKAIWTLICDATAVSGKIIAYYGD